VSSQRARSSSHVLRDVVAIGVARRFVSIDRMAKLSDELTSIQEFSSRMILSESLQLFGTMVALVA
jgi:hypothetical protein